MNAEEKNSDIGFFINKKLNNTRENIKHITKQKVKLSFISEHNKADNKFTLDDLVNF